MKKWFFVCLLCLVFYVKTPEVRADESCIPDNNPTFYNIQKDIEYEIGLSKPDYLSGVSATDSCGNAIANDEIDVVDKYVKYDTEGDYPVYYYLKSTSANTTVHVVYDMTAPVINVADSVTVEVNTTYDFSSGVTASDNKDNDVTGHLVVDSGEVNFSKVGTYHVYYSVSDSSGNTGTKTVVVNVVDTTKPEISNLSDITLEVHSDVANYDWWKNVIINDNSLIPPQKTLMKDGLNPDVIGTYPVTYDVKDQSNNETALTIHVTIVDTTKPIIVNSHDLVFNVNDRLDDINFKDGISVTDNYDGDIPLSKLVVDSSNVNLNVPGVYKVYYFVSDSSGNYATAQISVTVTDNDEPVINGAADLEFPVNSENVNYLANVTAADITDGDLTSKIIVYDDMVDLTKTGVYTLYYAVFDSSGNETIKKIKVTVYDREKPIIEGVTDRFLEVNSPSYNLLEGISATDNFDGNITDFIQVTTDLNISVLGSYTVTYYVEDSNGNFDEKTATVTVRDTTPPEFFHVTDLTVVSGTDINPLKNITAEDNYDGDLTASISLSGTYDLHTPGTYPLTIELADSSGNVNSKVFNLIVKRAPGSANYTLYYIIGGIGAALVAAGVFGLKTRR